MAKDGTLRGGRRAGSGAKPTPAFEKITEGKDARVLHIASLSTHQIWKRAGILKVA